MMKNNSTYFRFLAMIVTSMITMFLLTYSNTFSSDHIYWSETRFYMVFMMGAAMAVIMLSFMLSMYKDKTKNMSIFLGSFLVFVVSLWLVRSQTTVGDSSWMQAMIPHHSIAVLTSERADIKDVRVRELADKIIKAQRKEIKEMSWLIKDIEQNGPVTNQDEIDNRSVPYFEGQLNPASELSE